MTRCLIFHTLTSRTWNFSISHADPEQPPLLALVAALVDDHREIVRMAQIIQLPAEASISERAIEHHGITQAMAAEHGIPLHDAIAEFRDLAERAEFYAAFSITHHASVLQRAAKLCQIDMPTLASLCLMMRSTNPCKIATRSGTYKLPKLTEAFEHFTKKRYAVPYTESAQEILNYHLRARTLIWHGIRQAEKRELQRAARPLVLQPRKPAQSPA